MRSARALVAGAALAGTLALVGPAATAYADAWPGDNGHSSGHEDSGYKGKEDSGGWKSKEDGGDSWKGKEETGGSWKSKGDEDSWKKPHGGIHTGGGGLNLSGGGLGAGAVLLLGGLGAGAYALRRRTTPAGTNAAV